MNRIEKNSFIHDERRFKSYEDEQAEKIQKVFRGFQVRKSFLEKSFYPRYSLTCSLLDESTPRAQDGKTIVFLPLNMPEVVIKKTGQEIARERFFKMEAIRGIVRAERLEHLIIPKVRGYKEFLIEERLPIQTSETYNASLYLSNLDLFDDLVKEFTHFFFKAYIDYLVEKNFDDNSVIRIRYDNIPFIFHEKDGKKSVSLGLIDLERSKVGTGIKSNAHKLYILSSIFPFHTHIIEEEAQKASVPIGEKERKVMEDAIFQSKQYLEKKAKISS